MLLVARTVSRLEAVAAGIVGEGGEALALPCDLNDGDAVARLADALPGLAPDILVSNAGKSIRRPILHSLDRFHDVTRTANINFLAPAASRSPPSPGWSGAAGRSSTCRR